MSGKLNRKTLPFALSLCSCVLLVSVYITLSASIAFSTPQIKAKPAGAIQVQLEPSQPWKTGVPITLRAKIHTNIETNNIHYEWKIPEGVALIYGDKVKEDNQPLAAGFETTQEIVISSPTDKDVPLLFHCYTMVNGKKLGNTAIFKLKPGSAPIAPAIAPPEKPKEEEKLPNGYQKGKG